MNPPERPHARAPGACGVRITWGVRGGTELPVLLEVLHEHVNASALPALGWRFSGTFCTLPLSVPIGRRLNFLYIFTFVISCYGVAAAVSWNSRYPKLPTPLFSAL